MIMIAEALPGLKRFLSVVGAKESCLRLMMRVIVAFVMHCGRMSCLQAGGAVRTEPRHRAQISRFLQRRRWRRLDVGGAVRQLLWACDLGKSKCLFIVDATLVSQQGRRTENTYSTGNRRRRPQKGRRYGKQKHTRKQCHSFTMGLLISPSGVRIPFSRPHYTAEYCQEKGIPHHGRVRRGDDPRFAAAARPRGGAGGHRL